MSNTQTTSEITAKPISVIDTQFPTISKGLYLLSKLKNRIEAKTQERKKNNPFLSSDPNKPPQSAVSELQSAIDILQPMTLLHQQISAFNTMKQSGFIFPSFFGNNEYPLTIIQLRETEKYLVPLLELLSTHLMKQATDIQNMCTDYDKIIDRALDAELKAKDADYERQVKSANDVGDAVPTEESLKLQKETATRIANAKKSIKIDPIKIKTLLNKVNEVKTNLNKTNLNIRLDSINSQSVLSERTVFEELLKQRAHEMLGLTSTEVLSTLTDLTSEELLPLVELNSKINTIMGNIHSAINSVQVVSYKKGVKGVVEHPLVDKAESYFQDIFFNMHVLMQCVQVKHHTMCLKFMNMHPLLNIPIAVSGMINLGYVEKEKNSRRGKSTSTFDNDYTIANTLETFKRLFKDAEDEKLKAETENEKAIQEEISAKQTSRTSSGNALKDGELKEIDAAIRASKKKTFVLSPDLEKAKNRVNELSTIVDELQSVDRKAANAMLTVCIPKARQMNWAQVDDMIPGWD